MILAAVHSTVLGKLAISALMIWMVAIVLFFLGGFKVYPWEDGYWWKAAYVLVWIGSLILVGCAFAGVWGVR